MPRWLIAATLAFVSVLSHAQSCDTGRQHRAAAEVATLQAQLRAIKPGDMNTQVPAEAQRVIPPFRAALAEAARSVLACSEIAADPAALQATLARMLQANPPQPAGGTIAKDDPRFAEFLASGYGHNLVVHVTRPSANLLQVQFSFHIECGDDSLLQIFEAASAHWSERLLWQAEPYDEIGGAFGGPFETALLPGDAPGAWRAVVLHGHPWCTSRWSGFDADVLAPSAQPTAPRVVAHLPSPFLLDHDLTLTAKGNLFTIRFQKGALDMGVMDRPSILRYEVVGDTVRRIQPIASNGRYFVDEWLQIPWSDAVRFSDPGALPALKAAHDRFAANRDSKQPWDYTYGTVWACHDNTKHFQVELDVDDPHTGNRAAYYQVVENGDGYTMMAADSTRPDMRCAGPDLMKAASKSH